MDEKSTTCTSEILALYRTDYSRSLHVREIARLLIGSHVTLIPYLKRLEEGRILVSAMVGRNKEYRLNPDNLIVLHQMAISERLVAVDYLGKHFLIKKVAELLLGLDLTGTLVLFGSFAKGNASDTSDLDLFYLGALSEKQKSRIREIGRTYGREINVKTATVESFRAGLRTGDNLVKEIVRNHIILQNPDLLVGLLWRHYVEQ